MVRYSFRKAIETLGVGILGTVGSVVAGSIIAGSAIAQNGIVPDETLNNPSTVSTIETNSNLTEISGGNISGSDLFHSFQEFNIETQQTVYFVNPNSINNIFSRVTGNNNSEILGSLGVLGSANLYFFNPNGVSFGPEATLDIEGNLSIYAAAIGFDDERLFETTATSSRPLLTTNLPFGLQVGQPTEDAKVENVGNLSLTDGASLSFVGGAIENAGVIQIPNGTVHLIGHDILLIDDSKIDVSSSNGGGQVFIGRAPEYGLIADSIRIDESALINASALHAGQGGRVIIWSAENTDFSGLILAQGGALSGDGGFVEVSGEQNLIYAGSVNAGAPAGEIGTLLIDPTDIVVVADGENTSDLNDVNQFGDPDLTVDGTRIAASALSNSPNNVVLEATQNIIFNADVDITAPRVGITAIAGNDIVLNSFIQTSGGGEVKLDAGRNISLTNPVSFIWSYGEDITVTAGDIVALQNGAQIDTAPFSGDSGDITVASRQLLLTDGAQLKVAAFFGGAGGNLNLDVSEQIELSGIGLDPFGNTVSTGLITSDPLLASFEVSGMVDISAPIIRIRDGASIGSQIIGGFSTGGNVTIREAELVEVIGFSTTASGESLSGIFASPDISGSAGSITIETENLTIKNGGLITTSADGTGAEGNLTIDANSVILSGSSAGGSVSGLVANTLGLGSPGAVRIIDAQRVEITDGATIDVSALLPAVTLPQSGSIDIETEYLELSNRAMLIVNNAGTIKVDASDSVVINNATLEGSNLFGGLTGSILIEAGHLDIFNQGLITTSTFNSEEGGDIGIEVDNTFNLDNSFISAAAISGNRNGGSITISARDFNLSNRAAVDSLAGAQARAGTIDIEVDNLSLREQSQISVSGLESESRTGNLDVRANFVQLEGGSRLEAAAPSSDGGNIFLTLDNLLVLRDSSSISAEAGTEESNLLLTPQPGLGNGGNVSIAAPFIVTIPGEDSDITANAFLGDGGRVDITTQGLFGIEFREQRTAQNDITASSEFGLNGIVDISAPDNSFLQDNLSELPDNLISSESLVATSCVARSNTATGTLSISETRGLLQQPTDASTTNFQVGTVQSIPTETATRPDNRPVIEPESIYVLADGRLVMSRTCQ